MNSVPTKILIVDDSALFRQSIQNVLRELTDAEIVGAAKNGIEALEKIDELDPDLLTLDVQMPDMDGIEVLHEINRRRLRPKAIMVSSLTTEGAKVTTEALLEGAFDFILKPVTNDSRANRQQLRDALETKISAFRESHLRRVMKRRSLETKTAKEVVESVPSPVSSCEAVILGASTGGPEALKIVLSKLPKDLAAPVFVVQHMPGQYTRSLAARLNELCGLEIVEAEDRMEARSGRAMIAPGGKQMRLEASESGLRVRIVDDESNRGISPSVDHFLSSVVDVLGGQALAVVMTGMGRDGVAGCRQLKEAGGYVFAQHQDDCVVFGMPKAVAEADLADRVLPLGKIAPAITRHVKRSLRT